MKKLSDISKKNIFEVPDGYFDKLPGVIQSRVAAKEKSVFYDWNWTTSLKLAIPVVLIAVAGLFWYRTSPPERINLQEELAQFSPEQVQDYLDIHDSGDENELSTDELVESSHWKKSDLDSLEKSVYSDYDLSHKEIEKVLDEYDNEL